MTEASIEPFTQDHLDGLIALVAAAGWTEYTDDAGRTYRALTAPGVTTLVAAVGGQVVGAIQVQSDGTASSAREGYNSTSALGPRVTTSALVRATRSAFA